MKNYILIYLVAFLVAGCAAPTREATVFTMETTRTATVRNTEKSAMADREDEEEWAGWEDEADENGTADQTDVADQQDQVDHKDEVDEKSTQAEAPTNEALSYLEEVALSGFEFGSAPHVVYKWTHDIDVSISGSPSESDQAALRSIIADLNELVAPLKVRHVADGGDITIWYGDDSQFSKRLSGYTPGNRGYFQVKYGMDYSLYASSILISTEVGAAARAHLVREELTQSLGFFNDSWAEEASIFYQGWTTTSRYSEQDKAIIRMLYDSRIKPGMSRLRVASILGA